MSKGKLVNRYSKKNGKRSITSKALSLATLAGLVIFGNSANADEVITVPTEGTLDKLHASDPATYQNGSAYEVADTGSYSVIQYEINKTTGEVSTDAKYLNIRNQGTGDQNLYFKWDTTNNEYKLDAGTATNKDFTVNVSAGTGDTNVYYKWTKDANDNLLLTQDGASSSDYALAAKYNSAVSTTQTSTNDFGTIKPTEGYSNWKERNVAVVSNTGTTSYTDTVFLNNTSSGTLQKEVNGYVYSTVYGGALSNNGTINSVNADFIGNSLTATVIYSGNDGYFNSYHNGGAISNHSVSGKSAYIGDITGDFINNHVSATSSGSLVSAHVAGGAIDNDGLSSTYKATINSITGDFINNYVTTDLGNASGGAIQNNDSASIINSITGDFIGNYAIGNSSYYVRGGAVYNCGTIDSIIGDFINNYSISGKNYVQGGALYNINTINSIKGDFVSNYGLSSTNYVQGGALFNTSKIDSITSNFVGNYAKSNSSYAQGGAVYNSSKISSVTGDFINNYTLSNSSYTQGGALYNSSTITSITGDFINNYAKSNSSYALGGAIYINSTSATKTDITGNFIGNKAITTHTNSNSFARGGAIALERNAILGTIKGNFTGNYIETKKTGYSEYQSNFGGAISNYIYNQTGNITIDSIEGNFVNNYITKNQEQANNYSFEVHGGAISNFANSNSTSYNPVINIGNIKGDFIGNKINSTSRAEGGAISNINSGSYGHVNIDEINANFINNIVSGSPAFGGAIYNNYTNVTIGNINGNFITNKSDDKNGTTNGGGAICNYGSTIGNINGNFTENTATSGRGVSGGAVFNLVGYIGNITGKFERNSTQGKLYEASSGGAINHSNGYIKSITADFTGNYATSQSASAQGGAMLVSGLIASNADDAKKIYVYEYTYTNTSTGETVTYWEQSNKTNIDNALAEGKKLIITKYSYSYNATESQWTNIQNNISNGTYITTDPTSTLTESDYWVAEGGIINTSFTNNYVKGNANSHGGAIYLSYNDLNLIADGNVAYNNGISTISGNYVNNTNNKEAIYLNATSSMNFIAQNNGKFIIDDYINGSNDNYSVTFKGDNTGKINLYNDVLKGAVTVAPDGEKLTMNLANDEIHNYSFGSLKSNQNAKWFIDVNVDDETADNITTTLTGSTGKVTLNGLNILSGDFDNVFDQDFKIQILKTQNDDLQLALTDDLASSIGTEKHIGTNYTDNFEAVQSVTKWDDTYYNHQTETKVYGKIGLATTDTTNDSIGMNISRTSSSINDIEQETLSYVNQSTLSERTFEANSADEVYKVGGDSANVVNIGTTGSGELIIKGVSQTDSNGEITRSTIDFQGNNGFVLNNDDTTLTLKDVKITKSSQALSSNNETSIINIDGAEISGNDAGIMTKGTVNITGTSTIKDDIILYSDNASVNVNNSDKVDLDAKIIGNGNAQFNVNNSVLDVKKSIIGVNTTLNNSTLNLADENLLTGNLTVNSASGINIANGNIGTLALGNVNLNGLLKMSVDADLANAKMDQLKATNATIGTGGAIQVEKINLLSPTTEKELSLLFTNNSDLANVVSYTGENEIVYSPIYKYITTYENKDGNGYFKFATPSRVGGGSTGGSSYQDFNPAVMASPVAAQSAAQVSMNQVFGTSFEHADGFMPLPAIERMSRLRGNMYAINDVSTTEQLLKQNGLSTDFNDNMDLNSFTDLDHTNKALWVKPYTSFERINLHNGPKVDMISYGTLFGGDSDFRKLKNGWANVGTLYIGYNGAQIDYNDVSSTFNGGVIGITESFYKKNFFTAITANVGAGFTEAHTMYGKDDMTMLMAGVASKTGYNFEFKEGKFIIQPSLLMSYSMINTFDYKNSAGVKIDSDPLHTIQLNPNVKFIANLKHEWQPYISVGMVYNLMNETKVTANNVKLPESSTKPYVEYGVGVQKHFGETFSGYAQAMVRNGGRNGISLTAGFRWALSDKNAKKDNKNVNKDDKNIKAQQKVVNKTGASKDSALQVNNNKMQIDYTKQIAAKSISQNAKNRNLARYNALIAE